MYSSLFTTISYTFKNLDLLLEAFRHPSISNQNHLQSYQRLEFLGDSVLSMIISELLIQQYPDETEGDLARRRSQAVCGETLAVVAKTLNLNAYIQVSATEEKLHARFNPKILEDALEALIGAIYLDGGFEVTKNFVIQYWEQDIHKHIKAPVDPKTFLQEWSQSKHLGIPKYVVVGKQGSDHSPLFTIEVQIKTMPTCQVVATSKKEGEKKAAQAMIDQIEQAKQDGHTTESKKD